MTPRTDFPDDVEVAIVAHNNLQTLKETLGSIADAGCPQARVIVVDVLSTDGTWDYLAATWPQVRVIRLTENKGPSPGRNAGIRAAGSRFVLLMDADVILMPEATVRLHAAMAADEPLAHGPSEGGEPGARRAEVTRLLRAGPEGRNELFELLYGELRGIAGLRMSGERATHTLQATALVHEVFIRLVDQRRVDWQNRAHFFGVAANVMRRILVDHARRHGARKRGDGVRCVSIDDAKGVAAPNEMPIVALDHALDRLETIDAELARIVELRTFGGLTIEEAAHVLGVSPSTAKRGWRTAKAWLARELGSGVRP